MEKGREYGLLIYSHVYDISLTIDLTPSNCWHLSVSFTFYWRKHLIGRKGQKHRVKKYPSYAKAKQKNAKEFSNLSTYFLTKLPTLKKPCTKYKRQ
jgi:hypothetical protein